MDSSLGDADCTLAYYYGAGDLSEKIDPKMVANRLCEPFDHLPWTGRTLQAVKQYWLDLAGAWLHVLQVEMPFYKSDLFNPGG